MCIYMLTIKLKSQPQNELSESEKRLKMCDGRKENYMKPLTQQVALN